MRTKTLLLTAALAAAGALSSMAQSNVYSLNIVGYVNVTLTNGGSGFTLFANQLDFDGTGTNNTLNNVLSTNMPNNTTVYKFNPSTGGYTASSYVTGIGWLPDGTATLNPGEGAFINVPTTATVTLVGNVLQGNLSTPYPAGFSIISSQVPQTGAIQTALGYTPQNNDTVYLFDPVAGYSAASFVTGIGWLPSEPSIAIGQSVFLDAAGAGNWTRTFTPQ